MRYFVSIISHVWLFFFIKVFFLTEAKSNKNFRKTSVFVLLCLHITLCNFLSFSFYFTFSPSRQAFGGTGNFFFFVHMFYWLLLLTRVSQNSLETPANSFAKVPCIVTSGACDREPREVRGADHTFKSCWSSWSTNRRNNLSDLLLLLLVKIIEKHFSIAVIRIIYI